jgi:hypothetical protein
LSSNFCFSSNEDNEVAVEIVKKRKYTKRKLQATPTEQSEKTKRRGPLRNKQVCVESQEEFNTDDDENPTPKSTKRMRNSGHSDFHINLATARNNEDTLRLKICDKLVSELMKNENSWPFLKPVSKRDVSIYVFCYCKLVVLCGSAFLLGSRLLRSYRAADGFRLDQEQNE